MRRLVSRSVLILLALGALVWWLALRPEAAFAGTWLESHTGLVVLALVAVLSLLLTVPGTLASIASNLRGSARKEPEDRFELSYATKASEVARSYDRRVSLVLDDGPPPGLIQSITFPFDPGALPTRGRVIGRLFSYACRFWNTGTRPLRDFVVALRVEPDDSDHRAHLIVASEEILEVKAEEELGGPSFEIRNRDNRTVDAVCDLLNPHQKAEIKITTVVEPVGLCLGPGHLRVAARGEGLPPAVECEWLSNEEAPTPKRKDDVMAIRRGGLRGWMGERLYTVSKLARVPSEWVARVAARLAFKRQKE